MASKSKDAAIYQPDPPRKRKGRHAKRPNKKSTRKKYRGQGRA